MYAGSERSRYSAVKVRASRGKMRSQYVKYVRRHDGSEGCKVAHVNDVISG